MGADWEEALKLAQKYLHVEDLNEIDEETLPVNWRWDDVQGYDFTGRKIDQKACGSCYTIATNGMLESRLKIWYGHETTLSSQFRLDCNFMNEACHGGWGYTDAAFLKSFYTVDEACAPYLGDLNPQGCEAYRNCDPVAGIDHFYFPG